MRPVIGPVKYGKEIGPGLASVLSKSNEQIALAIAEPSREIDPKYQAVQLLTDSGSIMTGVLESSSASQYILLDSKGERVAVAREDVQEFNVSEKSLMPDGLLEALDPESLNDLIGFLRDPNRLEGPVDQSRQSCTTSVAAASRQNAVLSLSICLLPFLWFWHKLTSCDSALESGSWLVTAAQVSGSTFCEPVFSIGVSRCLVKFSKRMI